MLAWLFVAILACFISSLLEAAAQGANMIALAGYLACTAIVTVAVINAMNSEGE